MPGFQQCVQDRVPDFLRNVTILCAKDHVLDVVRERIVVIDYVRPDIRHVINWNKAKNSQESMRVAGLPICNVEFFGFGILFGVSLVDKIDIIPLVCDCNVRGFPVIEHISNGDQFRSGVIDIVTTTSLPLHYCCGLFLGRGRLPKPTADGTKCPSSLVEIVVIAIGFYRFDKTRFDGCLAKGVELFLLVVGDVFGIIRQTAFFRWGKFDKVLGKRLDIRRPQRRIPPLATLEDLDKDKKSILVLIQSRLL
mmetsp:Transcript_2373/g.4958  ORF Transcript_2373/g.4958 Transcript_2373/m.4958 type:complete len:251 (-) Transcript_2373:332-1084(-)